MNMKRMMSSLIGFATLVGLFSIPVAVMTSGCNSQADVNKQALDDSYNKGVSDTKASMDAIKAEGYKQGQIDALAGKIKFRLTEHDDHSINWEPLQNPATEPSNAVRFRTANEMPYLAPMADGHGGYVYVPMQELSEKVER